MAIDTPAKIVVLGAGPIGLEAALYARYLGYDVEIYERGQVAENVRRWGHVPMFTRFGLNRSPLGIAALKAQDSGWQPPPDDAMLTGRQYAERYLLRLAKSDLLVDNLHEQSEVLAIGREGWLKHEGAGSEERADSDFQLLVRTTDATGHKHEQIVTAEAVLDTTGTYGRPNWLGPDGLPAAGELASSGPIEYGLPDVLGADRPRYAGRNILLVGEGDSAMTTLVALAELAAQTSDTWITWLTRRELPADEAAPASAETATAENAQDEILAHRQRLASKASRLAADDSNHVTHLSGSAVAALAWHADLDRFLVWLAGQTDEMQFDRVIANVGYRGDFRPLAELQLERCPLTGAAKPTEPGGILTSEPDFYILGAKSRGRDSHFTLAEGLEQIRQVFGVIGDRPALDLYSTMGKLA